MLNLRNKIIFFLCSIFCFLGCEPTSKPVTPAFYHWKTAFQPSVFESDYLDSLNVQTLYLKFFDVDLEEGQPIPKAIIYGRDLPIYFQHRTIIPTIFITNRTLKDISKATIQDLAKKIVYKIFQVTKDHRLHFQELQLDCDWTLSTKDNYFELISYIKEKLPKDIQLSATIRLHQIKFAKKTGIPPVDRGTLMYYNMGDLQDIHTANSILDNTIGQTYLENAAAYPLEIGLALPIFAWGVLYRNGQMIRLINDLRENDLRDTTLFTAKKNNLFEMKKSGYYKGYYLYQNDEIRLEKVTQEDLEEAAQIIETSFDSKINSVIFYHLDSANLATFPSPNLKKILNVFE